VRRLTPLAAATIVVATGALLYGWSVWGNGFLAFRGGGETGDVAANNAASGATDDAVVGVVSRDPDPSAPTELAEPETDAVAEMDSEPARLNRPAPVQEPASEGFDEPPEAETDAATVVPATGPIDDAITVAALPESPPSEPIEAHKTVQAEDNPAAAIADPVCPLPLPVAGVASPGDPACEAPADGAPSNANLAAPSAVETDSAMSESSQIVELNAPANQAAAIADKDAPATADSNALAVVQTETTVARVTPDVAAVPEAVADAVPSEAVPEPQTREQAVDNPVNAAAPTFDIVRVAPGGNAVIAGRAAPGDEVSVIDRDAVVGSAVADARGEWVVVPDQPLPAGPSEIGLVARSTAGIEAQSEQVVVLMVPDAPSAAVVADAPAAQPVAVLMARAGGGEARFLQGGVPGGGISAPGELRLESVSYDDAGDFDISGTAIPGNMIAGYLDNQPIGNTPVGTDGKWRLLPDKLIDPGLYTLRIDQIDESGLVVSRLETPFSIADLTTASVAEGLVVVQPGNSLWRIARRIYGKGVEHTVIFDANTDQIRDPNLIYPGQIFVLPGESADG